jgi:hypothetical protein
MKEIALSRADPKKIERIGALRREITIINSEIENLSKGGKSLEVIAKLSAISRADRESSAASEASYSIKRVADAFSTALGSECRILKGEELLGLIEGL